MSTDIAANPRDSTGGAHAKSRAWLLLFCVWGVALASTLGALSIGEGIGKRTCLLCWYQRAFMFPLAIILAVACFNGDAAIWRCGLPVAGVGLAIAPYHNLLFFGIIPKDIQPFTRTGSSYASADLNLIGVIPIPLLSIDAFASLTLLFLIIRRRLATAVFLSPSVATVLRLFPPPILGVILFLTGAQLALGACDISRDKGERFVTMATAALAIWNVGIAFLVGMAAYWLHRKELCDFRCHLVEAQQRRQLLAHRCQPRLCLVPLSRHWGR